MGKRAKLILVIIGLIIGLGIGGCLGYYYGYLKGASKRVEKFEKGEIPEGPDGCRTPEECDAYCAQPEM